MKNWLVVAMAFVFSLAFLALPAEDAEAQVSVGPQVTLWDFDEVGLGARVDVEVGAGIEEGVFQDLFLSFDGNLLLDTGDLTVFIFDANVAVPFEVEGAVTPYAGAGLNVFRSSVEGFSDTSGGLNLLGGILLDTGAVPLFGQLAYWTTGAGGVTLTAGVLFGR